MELSRYIYPIKKWWWLVAASTLVAATFSYLTILRQPTVYQSRTTLMIGTTINDPNPSNNEFLLSQQLAAAYADIANRDMVRIATMNALNINRLPEYLARALPNTQLIEIAVTDTDPERSQLVANELASQLVLLSPTSGQPEDQGRQEFINEQLNNLEAQIKETEDEIEKLQGELGNMISAQQIDDAQNQISALQLKLNAMRNNYGLLLSNTQQGAINTLTIIEPASLTVRPIGPNKIWTVLLAAVFGFILAACEAYLLEYLNDTLKSADDVARLFSAPIVGRIFEYADGSNENHLYDSANLNHPLTEAYRTLRTNIEFAEMERPLKTILVTSADIGDGKTSVAANLALSVAQRDKKVILIDADLRRPNIHKYFNLTNEQGLVDLFLGRAPIGDTIRLNKGKNVAVLTAGNTPSNPTELLSSKKMEKLLTKLKDVADVIVIDGPPFIVADAMILASKVDGILMVVRPGHTRQSLARIAIDQIKVAGAKLVGVVLNRIPRRDADYYAGKSYLYTYYQNNYGVEREDRIKIDLKKFRETLSPFTYKIAGSFKHLFKAVFKLSPK